jgi:GNAT superfamily N-acetyltransferase
MSEGNITIKRVGKADALVVRDLLRMPLKRFGMPSALWLAYIESKELPVGAACGWAVQKEARCWLRVDDKHREKGVGRALMAAAEAEAQKANLESIRPARMISGDHESFLKASGFTEDFTLVMYKSSIDAAHALVEPLFKRLEERNKIPENAEIVDLNEINKRGLTKETAMIIARNLGGHPQRILGRVTGKQPGFDLDFSFVILLDGQPIGILTSNYSEQLKMRVLPSIAVNPKFRNGWANLWLRYVGSAKAKQAGLSNDICFEVSKDYVDTVKYVDRLKAEPIGERKAFSKKIEMTSADLRETELVSL